MQHLINIQINKKLARISEPRDKITGVDFKKLRKGKKKLY